FALDRFDQDGRGCAGDRSFHGLQIVIWQMPKTGKQGRETLLHLFLAGGRNSSHRPPVKRSMKGQDFESRLADRERAGAFIAKFASQLDSGFIGFSAAV